jgi:CHAD domain-containing protein
LKSYAHIQDPEVLHAIRVEVKRIKGVLNLISFSVKKFNAHKHFIPFRTIFRQAGKIRETEVLYKLLLKYKIEGVKDAQLPDEKKINRLRIAFQKNLPGFLITLKGEKKKLSKVIRKVEKPDVENYLKKKKKELKRLLFPTFSKKTLHKARKIVKEIIYLSQVASKHKSDTFYGKLESTIGQWHDTTLLLPILKRNNQMDDVHHLKAMTKENLTSLKELTLQRYKN